MYKIYTTGYGNKKIDDFVQLLKMNEIKILIDVRTVPYSNYRQEFNRRNLAKTLEKQGIFYLHKPELGGKDENVKKNWEENLGRIINIEGNLVLMCAEGDIEKCHRKQLANMLKTKFNIETEELNWQDKNKKKQKLQPSLFNEPSSNEDPQ